MANRILFLCTGNTCRSPVAESVARELFGQMGLTFASAGLDARSGQPASAGSREFVRQAGASLDDHRSQIVSQELLADTAWVIGMTRSHAAIFRSRFADSFTGGIGVLGAAGVDLRHPIEGLEIEEVDDPYGGPPERYDRVCSRIRPLMAAWEPTLKKIVERKEADS